ncbi:MAG: HAD family hydrolase [Luteolibacter sp.]
MHLLFDLDGTLTDSRPGIITSIQYALAENGLNVPPAENLLWCIGPPILESFKKLVGAHADLFEPTVRTYRERYGSIGLFENSVYPDIENTLIELRELGHTLHVATSKATVYAQPIIDHFGLGKYFATVNGSELDGTRANKAQLIAHLLEREKIAPQDAVMIGDREHDMIGAKANGVTAIGVLWGYGTEDEQKETGAFTCVSSPLDLADIVSGIADNQPFEAVSN